MTLQTIEYLARQLVVGYQSCDKDVKKFLDHYDFWLVPFHNPDGEHKAPNLLLGYVTDCHRFRVHTDNG